MGRPALPALAAHWGVRYGARGAVDKTREEQAARLWSPPEVSHAGSCRALHLGRSITFCGESLMSPTIHSKQPPYVTDDRAAAQRDAQRRSSEQQVEYVLGLREDVDCDVEYIVSPFSDFPALRRSGGWLLDGSFGRPITADDLIAAYVCPEIDEAMMDATMRVTHGAPSLFIGHRDGAYLVAPITDWPRFSRVGWRQIDRLAGAGS